MKRLNWQTKNSLLAQSTVQCEWNLSLMIEMCAKINAFLRQKRTTGVDGQKSTKKINVTFQPSENEQKGESSRR